MPPSVPAPPRGTHSSCWICGLGSSWQRRLKPHLKHPWELSVTVLSPTDSPGAPSSQGHETRAVLTLRSLSQEGCEAAWKVNNPSGLVRGRQCSRGQMCSVSSVLSAPCPSFPRVLCSRESIRAAPGEAGTAQPSQGFVPFIRFNGPTFSSIEIRA